MIVGYHFAQSLFTKEENERYQKEIETADGPIKEPTGYEGELVGKEITMTIFKNDDGKEETKSYTFKISGVAEEPSKDWVKDKIFTLMNLLKVKFYHSQALMKVNRLLIYLIMRF